MESKSDGPAHQITKITFSNDGLPVGESSALDLTTHQTAYQMALSGQAASEVIAGLSATMIIPNAPVDGTLPIQFGIALGYGAPIFDDGQHYLQAMATWDTVKKAWYPGINLVQWSETYSYTYNFGAFAPGEAVSISVSQDSNQDQVTLRIAGETYFLQIITAYKGLFRFGYVGMLYFGSSTSQTGNVPDSCKQLPNPHTLSFNEIKVSPSSATPRWIAEYWQKEGPCGKYNIAVALDKSPDTYKADFELGDS